MAEVLAGEKNQPPKAHGQPGKQKTAGKKIKCPMCAPYAAHTKQKGDRSFIKGCLVALCCCWLCDMCFDFSVE